MEVFGRDLEVPADTLEGALVVGFVALERGEEVCGVDDVDLAVLRRIWEDVVKTLDGLHRVGLEVSVKSPRV